MERAWESSSVTLEWISGLPASTVTYDKLARSIRYAGNMLNNEKPEVVSENLEPAIPEDLKLARGKSLKIIREYQENRINWYENTVSLKRALSKDIAMFAARGVATADEYIDSAFSAVESSSEETVMGNSWQKSLSSISEDTLDTGDLTTVRENTLWVCEVKSQINTHNAASFPQELRGMRTRMKEHTGRRRSSGQPVKAAYCVLRDPRRNGKGYDEVRVFQSADIARENRDLDGFEYRYITGRQFWKWLTGFESEIAILMPLSGFQSMLGDVVREARENAKERLKRELRKELRAHDLGTTIDDVVRLRDLYL